MLRKERPLHASSKIYRAFVIGAALFAVLFISATPGRADGICVKNLTSDLTLNGVVASGAGGGACTVGPVWSQVGPVRYVSGPMSVPADAFMYAALRTGTNHLFIGIDLKGDPDLSDADMVQLVFDANNNDVFDNGDFLIQVQIWPTGASPVSTANTGGFPGADCNRATGPVMVRRFSGGVFQPLVADATVLTKLSYDYETVVDAENGIWNLEIDIPLGPGFPLQTTGSFFGIGTYIFKDEGHHTGVGEMQTGTVIRWPSSMKDRTDITDKDIFFVNPTVATELGDANLTGNCFDMNWTAPNAWVINGSPAGSGDYRLNRAANNLFHVTFYFDGPGTTATPLTNKGNVRLSLHPYGPGAGTGWEKTISNVDATQFNHATSVDFNFDFANPDPSLGNVGTLSFICASTYLENFPKDDVLGDDSNRLYVNYNYFTTSEYPQDLFFLGKDVPNLKPGESTTVMMRLESSNDPAAKKASTDGVSSKPVYASVGLPTLLISLTIFAVGFLAIGVSRKLRFMPKLKPLATVVAIVAVLALTLQFTCKKPKTQPGPVIGTDRWEIKNAKELGITQVKGEPDLYEMPIRFDEVKKVQVVFTGRDLPYKTVKQTFNPVGQDGQHNIMRVPAKTGEVVSIISFGLIDLDGPNGPLPPVSPTGMVVPATATGQPNIAGANNPAASAYLLSQGYYSPNEQAGALIGSFDNFQTSFVVGRGASIEIPPNAGELSLAVNALRGNFGPITGTYEINWTVTKAPSTPTHTNIVGDGTIRSPHFFDVWDVLTSMNVYSYYLVNSVGRDGRTRSQTRNLWGSAHMTIYDSHVR